MNCSCCCLQASCGLVGSNRKPITKIHFDNMVDCTLLTNTGAFLHKDTVLTLRLEVHSGHVAEVKGVRTRQDVATEIHPCNHVKCVVLSSREVSNAPC